MDGQTEVIRRCGAKADAEGRLLGFAVFYIWVPKVVA